MLFESFKRQRIEHPDDPAFLIAAGDRSLPISWKHFTDDIAAISWMIKKHAPKATIALLGENSYEWIVAHASCLFSGATVVPLDVNLSAEEIVQRIKFIGATVFLHSSLYEEKAKTALKQLPGIVFGGFGTRKADFYIFAASNAVKRAGKSIWDEPPPDADRVGTIVFTSGTTSEPRGAELTIKAIETFVESTSKAIPMNRGDRSLMLLPIHHIFGLATTYTMLVNGVALGVCPDFRRIYDAFQRFRADFAFLVPVLAHILASMIEQRGGNVQDALDWPIRWIVTGGAPLSRLTYERVTALGIPVFSGYGLTETAACFSMGHTDGLPIPCSAGKASLASGVETKVDQSTGELLVRGPCVMKGYFANPEATKKVIDSEGWFHTGDSGRIDEDGTVWISGRMSRTIILSSGKKVAPEELELQINSLPGILEVFVTGEGETRKICAEIYANIPEDRVMYLVQSLNKMLPVYKRIRKVVVRNEPFERTSSGKIRIR